MHQGSRYAKGRQYICHLPACSATDINGLVSIYLCASNLKIQQSTHYIYYLLVRLMTDIDDLDSVCMRASTVKTLQRYSFYSSSSSSLVADITHAQDLGFDHNARMTLMCCTKIPTSLDVARDVDGSGDATWDP